MNMKQIFLSRQAKIVVDVLMFLALIFAFVVSKSYEAEIMLWKSAHCIFGIILILLILVHIAQNWKLTRERTRDFSLLLACCSSVSG